MKSRTEGKRDSERFLKANVRLSEHAVFRTFALETVILNVKKGTYHGLNATAGRMLAVLDGSATVEGAAKKVAAEYGMPVEKIEGDMAELCQRLEERGLIEVLEDDGD